MLMNMFVQYGIPLLMMGMVPLSAWLLKLATAQGSKAGMSNQLLARLEHFAAVTVAAVNSSPMKDAILAASADGTVSAAEGAQLKAAALSMMKQLLGTEGVADITALLGVTEPDMLIGASIEKAVDTANTAAALVAKAAGVAPAAAGKTPPPLP